jgi:hypothetical protein
MTDFGGDFRVNELIIGQGLLRKYQSKHQLTIDIPHGSKSDRPHKHEIIVVSL